MEKPLVCNFIGYRVTGYVFYIDKEDSLQSFHINPEVLEKEQDIVKNIKYGWYGIKYPLAAKLDVFKIYTNNAQVFYKQLMLNLEEIEKPVPEQIVKACSNLDNFYFPGSYQAIY